MSFHLHCFHIYLVQMCGYQPGVQLGRVVKCIRQEVGQDAAAPYLEFLPHDISSASKSCIELRRRGIILYMQKELLECSWVFVEGNTTQKCERKYLCPQGLSRAQVIGHPYRCSAFQENMRPFPTDGRNRAHEN